MQTQPPSPSLPEPSSPTPKQQIKPPISSPTLSHLTSHITVPPHPHTPNHNATYHSIGTRVTTVSSIPHQLPDVGMYRTNKNKIEIQSRYVHTRNDICSLPQQGSCCRKRATSPMAYPRYPSTPYSTVCTEYRIHSRYASTERWTPIATPQIALSARKSLLHKPMYAHMC